LSERNSLRAGRALLALLLAAFALAWFANIDYRHLIRADEGRYAEIAREMLASGDWITPRLNGFKYFEKPPLQYWTTAAAFALFGVDEWTARLWTALTGFLGVLVTWFATRRLFSARSALYAAAITASSMLYASMGHFSSLDMGVTFFLSACAFAFALAQRDAASPSERLRWMIAAWAAAALATLSKGLIGVVLPAAAVTLYVILERDWRLLRRVHWIAGGLTGLAIAAPWFVLATRANPEFAQFFFVHEHFERFTSRVHGRYEPLWYFIPIVIAGFVPWTLLLAPALASGWRTRAHEHFKAARFLLVWCVTIFVFFSLSSSKLPSYVLPMFPALSMLVAVALTQRTGSWLRWQAGLSVAGGLLIAALAPVLLQRSSGSQTPPQLLEAYIPWLLGAGMALALGGLAAWLLARRGVTTSAVLSLAAGGLAAAQLALTGHESLSPVYSAYHIASQIGPRLPAEVPFFSVNSFDHSLPFYLRRTVAMVAYRDELAIPISWEPDKFIADYATFERRWRAAPLAYAVLPWRDYESFRQSGLPMVEVARDPRRVAVKTP
jgi:4-amino-4-deoxy-L-arabinose transferase-like glycosyltransferase